MQVYATTIIHKNKAFLFSCCFFLLLSTSFNLYATEGFFEVESLGLYPGASDVTSADFNGDTYDDLVMVYGLLASFPFAAPRFSLQNAQGQFSTLQEGANVSGNRVLAADFNGDGTQDVLIAGGAFEDGLVFPGSSAVYFNSGDWSQGSGFDFTSPLNMGGLHYAPEAAVGDLDNDGDVDIVLGITSGGNAGTVEVWLNQGMDQGGVIGTFLKTDYFENTGSFGVITALSLAQVSTQNDTLDLMFSRQGSNNINIALNDDNGSFLTNVVEIAVSGTVNDIKLLSYEVDNQPPQSYIVAALTGAASPVFNVVRAGNGNPTDYPMIWTLGTYVQQSEKIIPMTLGSQPAIFLSSSFDGSRDVGVTSLMLYGFNLFNDPELKPQSQCLLSGGAAALGLTAYIGKRSINSDFTDLSLLSPNGEVYKIENDQTSSSSVCCVSEKQFITVNEVSGSESMHEAPIHHLSTQISGGLDQVSLWLDSFQKFREIRSIIMPLTTDSQRYESLYAQHELQIINLMSDDVSLRTAWTDVLTSWNQPLNAMLDGSDADVVLSGQQMAHVATFLGLLQNEPGVGVTISNELALIQPLNSYAGGSLQNFTLDAINLVSPVIFKNSFE